MFMIIILSYRSICHLWNVSDENIKCLIITFDNVKYCLLQDFEIHIIYSSLVTKVAKLECSMSFKLINMSNIAYCNILKFI